MDGAVNGSGWLTIFSSSVPRDATNARYLLSGLQRGCDSLSGDEVSWISWVPSQLAIQMSESFLSVSLTARATT